MIDNIASHRWRDMIRPIQPFHWREAGLGIPALLGLLIAGWWRGDLVHGVIAASAAFSVGFGASRELAGHRWGAMAGAVVGMPLAAFFGTLAGQDVATYALGGAALAAICAALALIEADLWWVMLQGVFAFLVAGHFQGSVSAALMRGELVLLGGVCQLVMVWGLARLFPAAGRRLPGGPPLLRPGHRVLIAYSLRAALCVAALIVMVGPLGLPNGYWAPMTALLVLKPSLRDTLTRGWARLAGTLAGCILATLYAEATREMPWALMLGTACAAGAAYALQKANYAALSMAISANVVLLLSLVDRSALLNAEHRILATLLGGVLALVVSAISMGLFRPRE